jgi:hypothetical protein
MPILAWIYITLVCLLVAGTVQDGLRSREPAWWVGLNLVAVAIMLFMFAGYWAKGLVERIGLLGPCLLFFSLVWEIRTAPRAIDRWIDREPTEASPEARLVAKRIAFALELVLCGVGYSFGSVAALRAL